MIKQSLLALLTALTSLFYQSVDYVRSYSFFTPQQVATHAVAAQTSVAQHQAVHIVQQQPQLICGVCQAHIAQDAQDIVAVACNGVFHATHIECMRARFDEDHLDCPTCRMPLSESNLEHVLLLLNDGDAQPAPQPSAPEIHECAICFDELGGQDTLALPCAHLFHEVCVQPWLNQHHNCPTCRTIC